VPQDQTLVAQVRMQLILNPVHRSSCRPGGGGEIPAPFVHALRSRLDEMYRATRGPATLDFLYHFTTLVVHEAALSAAMPPTRSSTPRNDSPDLDRHRAYRRCLDAVQAWLDTYFATPLDTYPSLPAGTYWQLFHVTVCLHRVTTTRDDAAGWTAAAAREVVDLMPTVDRVIHTFERIKAKQAPSPSQPGGGEEDPALSIGLRKFWTLKKAWQAEMAALASAEGPEDDGNHNNNMPTEAAMVDDPGLFPGLATANWFDDDTLPDLLDFSWE